MGEDIKYLDKMVKEYKQFGDLDNPEYEDTDRIYQAIENLIKGYSELEEKTKKNIEPVLINNKMYFIDKELYEELLKDIKINYIPKTKIKSLILQIESAIDFMKTDKTRIKVDKNKQQEEDLRREIMHLKKIMEDK